MVRILRRQPIPTRRKLAAEFVAGQQPLNFLIFGQRAGPIASIPYASIQRSCSFSSDAAEARISLERASSLTARAIDTAPTNVDRAVIAVALLRSLLPVGSSR